MRYIDEKKKQRDDLRQQLAEAVKERATVVLGYGDLRRQLADAKAKWDNLSEAFAKLHQEHSSLCNRIEALADKYEREKWMPFPESVADLRALINPPKAETALDVLAWIEQHAGAVWDKDESMVKANFAKLRALLEKESDK